MRGDLISLLFFVILILAVVCGVSSSSNTSDPDPVPDNPPLPLIPNNEPGTVIWVTPDGKVYYIEAGSEKFWSFSSGLPIYSSYQQLPTHIVEKTNSSAVENFYIDRGDDGALYLYAAGQETKKLVWGAKELVQHAPVVLSGRGVIMGSRKTTTFLVDAKTGKVVRLFRSDSFPSVGGQGADETSILTRKDAEEWLVSTSTEVDDLEKALYVTRTDYTLKYTSEKTGQVLWYLMLADFEAKFRCKGIEDLFGGFSRSKWNKTNNCPPRPLVYQFRDWSSLSAQLQHSLPGGRVLSLPGGKVLSLPGPGHNPMLEPIDNVSPFYDGDENDTIFALPTSGAEERGGPPQIISAVESEVLAQPHSWLALLYCALPPVVALILYVQHAFCKRRVKPFKPSKDPKFQVLTTKKRKGRKSAVNKQTNVVGKRSDNVLPNNAVKDSDESEDAEMINAFLSSNFSGSNNSYGDGRRIGKLIVFNKEIAKGSNGTIVLEGNYDGRLVAVKRLVRTHHDVAVKEIQNLIASDRHPNIVRWYGVEYDSDFIYLSLERCMCSLQELISLYASQKETSNWNPIHEFLGPVEPKLQLLSSDGTNVELWKFNGYPSAGLLKLMRDVVCGLAHLHELGIIHRDLKPQNVLVLKDRSISAKISDMGISKLLDGDMSSLTKNSTGSGSSGWQAPEQLRHERQTRAVDLFSLGCILFFCITGGKHPFGESLERDINIVNDRKDLFLIDNIPEAMDLVSQLLDSNPNLRPKAVEVMNHPLFWNSEKRLSFLRDVSDRVELEDRENASELLGALESRAKFALGGKWDEKMDAALLNDIGRYRRYKFDSLRDLLRVIRNKLNHFRELSKEIQAILGPVPEGFDRYFSTRFPKLLIEVYKTISRYCADEDVFHKYFRSSLL